MPTVDLKRAAAIVGIHEHITRYAPDKSELQVQGESVIKAVEDAGLTKNDVDGLLTAGNIRNSGLNLADYLDMYPKMVDNTTVGGGSFEFHLSHALNAIAAGRINCAVITYSSLARSGGISVGTGKRDLQFIAAKQSHEPAFTMAGVTQNDIDMAMIYDSFTITVLETLEDLGFCKKGEGGHFVSGGRLQAGGELPINTGGGGLSSNHPGMRGIFLLLEATRQLRGQFEGTPRQVENCQVALSHGTGGALGSRHSGGTVILGRD